MRLKTNLPLTAILFVFLLAVLLPLVIAGCRSSGEPPEDGQTLLRYWEKWTGTESAAMKEIVKAYNDSQDRFHVQYMEVGGSQIDRKLLLSIAGGNPPDIAGFWNDRIVDYVQNGALLPLDSLMEGSDMSSADYLPRVMDSCRYEGFTWGLPLTPATLALFYNRRLFREAGLDPDSPPRTIAELDAYSELLTKRDEAGRITQLGFSPDIPGWWNHLWGLWFGGSLWDGASQVTVASPPFLEALEWANGYSEKYGVQQLDRFKAAAENFDSPQWPFFSERLAMVIQGVWTSNFIRRHCPNLDWDVAPFPTAGADSESTTFLQCDLLVIPKGASNPEGAWDFIQFTQRAENLERLNILHHKFSPRVEVSDGFYEMHPNPRIRLFQDLATNGTVHVAPAIPQFSDLQRWMIYAFNQVYKEGRDPSDTLREVQSEIQKGLDRSLNRWHRVASVRHEQWRDQWE